jgi:hypothetical protein
MMPDVDEVPMKRTIAFAACAVLLAAALPAAAQTAPKPARPADSAREAALQRCKENRGTACDTREGLEEWLRQERPITPEEQQAAAGARRHRETCARNPKAAGC